MYFEWKRDSKVTFGEGLVIQGWNVFFLYYVLELAECLLFWCALSLFMKGIYYCIMFSDLIDYGTFFWYVSLEKLVLCGKHSKTHSFIPKLFIWSCISDSMQALLGLQDLALLTGTCLVVLFRMSQAVPILSSNSHRLCASFSGISMLRDYFGTALSYSNLTVKKPLWVFVSFPLPWSTHTKAFFSEALKKDWWFCRGGGRG